MIKKLIYITILSITIPLLFTSCSPNNSSNDTVQTEISNTQTSSIPLEDTNNELPIFYRKFAYILDINPENNTIMIGTTLDADYEMQTCVFIKKDTEIIVDARQSSIKSLAVGDAILITYTDGIMESAPAQMHHPTQIKVVKPYTQTVYILDINLEHNYIMVGESLDTDYTMQTRVFIKDITTILINGTPSHLENLTVGSQISLTSIGGIKESAPAQMHHPTQIEVLE